MHSNQDNVRISRKLAVLLKGTELIADTQGMAHLMDYFEKKKEDIT